MSEGDLVSLRLFVVAPDEAQQALWREGAVMASMPIELECGDDVAAKVALSRGGVDVCVLDDALSESDQASVLKAARRVKPAPLICLSTARSGARGDIANVLRRPKNAKEAGTLVELCIELTAPIAVLIIDEHDTTRRVVRKILSASRFELDIREAADNTDALSHLRRELTKGMVFLDYDMPGLNGADF
jgi:response regulator receiver domain-containing protein